MRKFGMLFFCSLIMLKGRGQISSLVPATLSTPQPSTFQPVIINYNTRTVTAISNVNNNVMSVYEQDKKHLAERRKEIDVLNQEIAKYNTERSNTNRQRI